VPDHPLQRIQEKIMNKSLPVAFSLFLLLASSLSAKDSAASILAGLPARMADCEREEGSIKDFGDPALGHSIVYNADQILITIYVYDLGQPRIVAGITDPIVQKAFAMAKSDVVTAYERGNYTKMKLLSDGAITHGSSGQTLRAQYHLERGDKSGNPGLEVLSEIYVMGARDHIVKVRVSAARDIEERAGKTANSFVAALLDRLGSKK